MRALKVANIGERSNSSPNLEKIGFPAEVNMKKLKEGILTSSDFSI